MALEQTLFFTSRYSLSMRRSTRILGVAVSRAFGVAG